MARTLRRQGSRTYRSHARQRRLHVHRHHPAGVAAGVDRHPPGEPRSRSSVTAWAGCSRAAWPSAAPTSCPASSRWGARCSRRAPTTSRWPPASTCWSAEPGRGARADVGGVRGRVVRATQLRREPAGGAGRRLVHRDLQQARRHRRLAGVRGPAGRVGRGQCLALGMAFDPRVIDRVTAALGRRPTGLVLEVDRGESAWCSGQLVLGADLADRAAASASPATRSCSRRRGSGRPASGRRR